MLKKTAFQYPQCIFWALGVITPLTYVAAGAVNFYYGHYSQKFIPFPSTCVVGTPERYIFGWSAVVVVPLMLMASWRVYKHLTHPKLFVRRTPLVTGLAIASSLFGVLAAGFYTASAFWTLSDGFWWQIGFHDAALGCLVFYFLLFDTVMYRARSGLPTRIWIHDSFIVALALFYIGGTYKILTGMMGVILSVWSVCGYILIALLFTRYVMQGWQMMGTSFVVQSKKHRN